MKQITRYILALAAVLLFTSEVMANNTATIIKQINGAAAGATNPGEVVYKNGTIIVTPSADYYLTMADLTVVKTIDGQNAEARRRAPGINNTVVVTASDPGADPSGVTTYTFTVTDTKYDYEITANFHPRTSVEGATVTVAGTCTYNGSPQKPDVTVVVGGVTLTKGTDYDVYYADSINAGTGKITIVGTRTYKGTKTGIQYTINEAAMVVTSSGYNGPYDTKPHGITVTAPDDATVRYGTTAGNYNLNASPTYTEGGTYTVFYQVTKPNYATVTGSATVTIASIDPVVVYKKYVFTAKIGKPFETPELTVEPAGLPITYSTSDPEVATVDAQTGEVTLVSPGKAYIYANFAGNANYNAVSDYYVLTVLQRDIDPIDEDVTITWRDEDFFFINDEGNREEIKLINVVIYDVLFTLDISGDPSESDGYDETDHSVVLNHSVSNDLINYIVTHGGEPGTDKYAEQYTGMTFKVPAGTGYVIIECKTDGEHVMMIKIGNLAPIGFNHTDIQKDSVFYECATPTWVHVYNGGEVRSSNARVKSVHRSKKTVGQVRVYSVTRRSQKATGIEMINSDAFDETERWYDLQGNRINRPTKKGIYIQRGQKVVVR